MIYWIYTQVDPSYLVVYICLHMFTLLLARHHVSKALQKPS